MTLCKTTDLVQKVRFFTDPASQPAVVRGVHSGLATYLEERKIIVEQEDHPWQDLCREYIASCIKYYSWMRDWSKKEEQSDWEITLQKILAEFQERKEIMYSDFFEFFIPQRYKPSRRSLNKAHLDIIISPMFYWANWETFLGVTLKTRTRPYRIHVMGIFDQYLSGETEKELTQRAVALAYHEATHLEQAAHCPQQECIYSSSNGGDLPRLDALFQRYQTTGRFPKCNEHEDRVSRAVAEGIIFVDDRRKPEIE